MKSWFFVLFISVVLAIYSAINYYIIKRGLEVFPAGSDYRNYFVILIIILAASYLVGRILENVSINAFSSSLIWIGAFWLGIMTYLFLMILLIDILRSINSFLPFFPEFITSNYQRTKTITAIVITVIALSTVLLGHLNTRFPVLKKLEIKLDKPAGNLKSLRAVVFSDVHLGTIIGRGYLRKIVDQVNDLKPDIILIPGDIIDENIEPVLEYNIGEILVQFKSKYGVYAVTGNHEYIGGVEKAKEYLASHNIKLLNDESILIDSSFYLVGREDRAISQFTNRKRKSLNEIMKSVDKLFPVILMDHQPFNLDEAVENGVDIQLSGHTHHGQLYPFNYITNAIYELSWGYLRKENTHFYVSCGVGGWGPPIRTNSRPEILLIEIKFK